LKNEIVASCDYLASRDCAEPVDGGRLEDVVATGWRDFFRKNISGRILGKEPSHVSTVILPANHAPKSVIPPEKLLLGFLVLRHRLDEV